jgi:hypothetical protein
MLYVAATVERAMNVQQVLMQALSGKITWVQAAEILGLEPRSVRCGFRPNVSSQIGPS